jgi:PAS domain S-box-containing protein
MKFFYSISFKIWIYFSLILFLASGIVIYYFPAQQKKSIIKYRGKELDELCRSLALGVELSLDASDFQKLNKSLNHYRNKKNEFDFLVLLQKDSISGKEIVFSEINDNSEFDYWKIDTAKFLIKSAEFKTNVMNGKVIIGLSKFRVNKEVQNTNLPIYVTLIVIFLVALILFYVVARNISAPINKAILNAKLLQEERFNEFNIEPKKSKDEITQLQNALISLKQSLFKQKLDNINLLETLESKIVERTESLNSTLIKLKEAQDIALLGYFRYYFTSNKFICSENLSNLLSISLDSEVDFTEIKNLIDKEYVDDFEKCFKDDSVQSFNIEVKTNLPDKSGGFKWIEINAKCIMSNNNKDFHLSGTIQDITSRKISEVELRRLSQAVKNSFNGIIITDLNQNILWINDSVVRLTGYGKDEILGKKPKMFQFEGTDNETKKHIRENLNSLKSFKTQIQNIGKNGNIYWLELYIQPILDDRGIPEGFMAIEIDITDRIEKENLIKRYISEIETKQQEISAINESLEVKVAEKTKDLELSILQIQKSQEEIVRKEKMATLGVLVAGIAHEVNTPLGAIKASADNLEYLFYSEFVKIINSISIDSLKRSIDLYLKLQLRNTPGTIVQRQNAKNIFNSLMILNHDYNKSLMLSKELATIGFENINDDVISLLEDDSFEAIIGAVKLLLNIQRSLNTVNEAAIKSSKIIKALNIYSHGNALLQQTNFNLKENIDTIITLLWNKIKNNAIVINNIPENIFLTGFEDELSQVWTNIINNALQASKNKCVITINYQLLNNFHDISISNNGPKIPDEFIDKIFDEFFTTKKRGEGTGLGLNIVKNIIEKHNGNIKCISNDLLTTFEISLPIA